MVAPALRDEELLARLVRFDTTSALPNRPLADFLADYLDGPGVVVHRDDGDDGWANLVVRVGPPLDGDGGRGLVLSGHMDVVPADEEGWRSDPFRLTDGGDRWVGRGSADMKGFLALAANLARRAAGERLAAPLVLALTYDEEVGSLGARHLVEHRAELADAVGPLPRSAVIGEPTELAAVRLHKGHLKLRLAFTGRSAHSGYPHLGINAIEAAGAAITALTGLRAELEAEEPPHAEYFPEVPFVALNLGTVEGGAAINVVPDRCALEVGVRVLPGMESAEVAARIRAAATAAVASTGATVDITTLSDSPPLATPAEADLHRRLTGRLAQDGSRSVSFSSDAGQLRRLGLDCVLFGPGSIEVAHRPNEWLPKAQLAAARGHLEALVEDLCAP